MNASHAITSHQKQQAAAATSILIVEDSLPERERLKIMLARHGYQIFVATDGAEALQVLRQQNIDVVLSDWRMPRMDGLALCKEIHSQTIAPYFILLTGLDSKNDLITAMDAGADDFLIKPCNAEELRARVAAGSRVIEMRKALQAQNQELLDSLKRELDLRDCMQKDLQAAAKLQQQLLPKGQLSVKDLQIAQIFKGAQKVAGDSFAVVPLSSQLVSFYHIDVAGHGVRSSMLSFALSRLLSDPMSLACIRQWIEQGADSNSFSTAAVAQELNQKFQSGQDCEDYFTMFYGVLNLNTGEVQYTQAGHPPPFVVSRDGAVERIEKGGMPIGLLPDGDFQQDSFRINPGDRLVIYSDGLFECKINDDTQITADALCRLFKTLSKLNIEGLQNNLNQLLQRITDTQALEDDVSLMVIQRS